MSGLDFFSKMSEEDSGKRQDMLKKASGDQTRKPVLPGIYIMKVGTMAWTDKKEHTMKTSPDIGPSRNGALLLNILFQVDDEGTEVVPNGSSIFHTMTLSPALGADDTKINNTLRFLKPQLAALIGHENIELTDKWFTEWCTADFKNENGKYVVTRPHKMTQQVLVTVDETINKLTNKPKIAVVKIEKPRPGDKSATYKYNSENTEYPEKNIEDDIPANVDISPAEEADKKPVKHMDTSKITGNKTEEDF